MNEINQFTFFRDYYDVLKELKKEDKKILLEAIVDYVFEDIEPDLNSLNKAIWNLIKRPLIISKNKSNCARKVEQIKNEKKSNQNQKEIKSKSKENQKEIKQESTDPISLSLSLSSSISNLDLEDKSVREETFKKIQNEFNNIELSKVTVLSKTRKDKLKLRITEFGEKLIIEAIKKIPKSKFLMGDNKQGWKCSFDWLIENDKNILKVYEGNYESKEKMNPVLASYLDELAKENSND